MPFPAPKRSDIVLQKAGALAAREFVVLDAYIIEKIKREQERDHERAPLHIDVPIRPERPRPNHRHDDEDESPTTDRGVVIISF